METPLLLLKLNFASDLKALWTFAALVVVIAAAFATSSRTLLLLLSRTFLSGKSVIPHPSSYASFSYSDDDDDDSCSDDDDSDDEEEDDNEETTPSPSPSPSPSSSEEEFQGQYGNFDSVVKFWDEAFRSGPPSSVLTAEEVVVRRWDARSAEVVATWRAEGAEGAVAAAGFGRRVERVYVGDGVGRVTAVDLRNVRSVPERHAFSGDGIRKEDKLMIV